MLNVLIIFFNNGIFSALTPNEFVPKITPSKPENITRTLMPIEHKHLPYFFF